jgi:hypothetical protein
MAHGEIHEVESGCAYLDLALHLLTATANEHVDHLFAHASYHDSSSSPIVYPFHLSHRACP